MSYLGNAGHVLVVVVHESIQRVQQDVFGDPLRGGVASFGHQARDGHGLFKGHLQPLLVIIYLGYPRPGVEAVVAGVEGGSVGVGVE